MVLRTLSWIGLDELYVRNSLCRYAQALVSHRVKTGYGRTIRQERAQRQSPDQALARAEWSWPEVAAARHAAHFPNLVIQDYKDWARRASYLQRRGFDIETIRQVLGEWQSPG